MLSRREFLAVTISSAFAAPTANAFMPKGIFENLDRHKVDTANEVSKQNISTHNNSSKRIFNEPQLWAQKLISAAESQIGQTVIYDGAYKGLKFPMGDIPRERGVCTDVIIRAYRDAFDFDLQLHVHNDMKKAFSKYPKIWGLKSTDKNIDHRRVPNLERFLARKNASLPITQNAKEYLPGDLVTQRLPGNLPHIVIVSHVANADNSRPLVLHNIGAGTREEDRLFDYKITGHFRFNPSV